MRGQRVFITHTAVSGISSDRFGITLIGQKISLGVREDRSMSALLFIYAQTNLLDTGYQFQNFTQRIRRDFLVTIIFADDQCEDSLQTRNTCLLYTSRCV